MSKAQGKFDFSVHHPFKKRGVQKYYTDLNLTSYYMEHFLGIFFLFPFKPKSSIHLFSRLFFFLLHRPFRTVIFG